MNEHEFLKDAVIATMVVNAIVSLAIAFSAGYSRRQKIMQIGCVWVLPVVGAAVFGLFLFSQRGQPGWTGYPSRNDDTGKVACHYRDHNP